MKEINLTCRNEAQKVVRLIQKLRRLNKMLSTYYNRLEDQIYPDQCVRLSFNHCATITGRLSSDFQQTPQKGKAKVKMIFVSRYE